MQVPAVNSPLTIIALFVALIELFLAFPVTQLDGPERLIMVLFMTLFPLFVASLFFFVLWRKPLHLYSPMDIPEVLQERYQSPEPAKTAAEIRIEELEQKLRQVQESAVKPEAAVLPQDAASRLAEEVGLTPESEVSAIESEVRAAVGSERVDEVALERAKRTVQRSRRQSERAKEQFIQEEMARFRSWLATRGFADLPELPKVVIEPPSLLNAYLDMNSDSAHFGASVSGDSDMIAHTYFHKVLYGLGVLTEFAGDTGVLVEGFCDYYACAFNDDPLLGEEFAKVVGLPQGWVRDLTEVVRLSELPDEPHARGLVWSGACWELREQYGDEQVDAALHSALTKLGARTTLREAALALRDELAAAVGEEAKAVVQKAFQKRGVRIRA